MGWVAKTARVGKKQVNLRQGSAVATLLIAAAIVATGVLLTVDSNSPTFKTNVHDTLDSEVNVALQRGVYQGIADWLLNGFSDQNKVWYCNYPYSPSVNESNSSIETFIEDRLEGYLDALTEEGINISMPNIRAKVPDREYYDLPEDFVTIELTEMFVETDDGETLEVSDLSQTIDVPYRAWLMFEGMQNWTRSNAGNITQLLYEDLFYGVACQAVGSCCGCPESSTYISPSTKDQLKLKEDDVYPVLNKSVGFLNDFFVNTPITCDYEVDRIHIENSEKSNWTETQTSYLNCSDTILDWDEENYVYEYKMWHDHFTLPAPDADANGGCPTFNETVNATYRPKFVEFDQDLDETRSNTTVSQVCRYTEIFPKVHNEHFAIDKKLGLLMTIRCQDPETLVEGETGLEPLKAEIQQRISVRLDCPTPTEEDMEREDKGALTGCPGGGSCFAPGTQITMADGSYKSIEDVMVNDRVLSYDTIAGQFGIGTVLELESPIRDGIHTIHLSNGVRLNVTSEHPFFIRNQEGETGWGSIDPNATYEETAQFEYLFTLEVGDEIMQQDETWAEVLVITYEVGALKTFNLKEVSGNNNFFAAGSLTHNKCCFPAGTMITMADGRLKPIEEVQVGDKTLSYDEKNHKLVATTVEEIENPVREGLFTMKFIDGRQLRVTNDHPLFIQRFSEGKSVYKGWGAMDPIAALEYSHGGFGLEQIRLGDHILDDQLGWIQIAEISYEKGAIQTYNLKHVSLQNNFFADGFLAHNKIYGFIGPVCDPDINCPECQGCVIVNGEPTCLAAPNTECSGICTVCGPNGCDTPAPAGTPCPGDCMTCDGVNTGAAACTVFDDPIMENQACSEHCLLCAGDGTGCTKAPEYVGQKDDCPFCGTCGTDATCVADPNRLGEKCGECKQCGADGECSQLAPVGTDDCSRACQRCNADGTCDAATGYALAVSDCGSCKTCGPNGCQADPAKNGRKCGENKCRIGTCNNGNCEYSNKPDGTACGTSGGGACKKVCNNGQCNRGTNAGASCNAGHQCVPGVCQADGDCSLGSSLYGKQCCGDKLCNAGDPCCPHGGGPGVWTCGACDDSTT